MPMTASGRETLKDFKKRYGAKKGEDYFYAKMNKSKKFKHAMEKGGSRRHRKRHR